MLALSAIGQEGSVDGTKIIFNYENLKVPIYFSNGVDKELKAYNTVINKEKGFFSFYGTELSYDDSRSPTDSVRVSFGVMTSTLRFISYDHDGTINIVVCKNGYIIDNITLKKKK